MAKNQHVIPYEGKWAVQSEGHKKLSSVFDTKQEAIDKARELARISGTEIRIHGRNGQIFHSSDAPSRLSENAIRTVVRDFANKRPSSKQ